MLLSKRSIIGGMMAYQMMRPRIVKAESTPITNNLIKELNKRDNNSEINALQSNLEGWKPITNFKDVLQTLNIFILKDLDYIRVMQEPPLKPYQKIRTRNMIMEYYNQTNNSKEKEMYYEILNYFNLLE